MISVAEIERLAALVLRRPNGSRITTRRLEDNRADGSRWVVLEVLTTNAAESSPPPHRVHDSRRVAVPEQRVRRDGVERDEGYVEALTKLRALLEAEIAAKRSRVEASIQKEP